MKKVYGLIGSSSHKEAWHKVLSLTLLYFLVLTLLTPVYLPLREPERASENYTALQKPQLTEDPAIKPQQESQPEPEPKVEPPQEEPKVWNKEELEERLYERYVQPKLIEKKTVYLTFDDGPHPVTTPAILEILAEADIRATFFVLGSKAERHPELILAIKEGGHKLANHTYSHHYKYLYKSVDNYLAELEKTRVILKGLVQEDIRLTRAPGGTAGHFRLEYYEALEKGGYVTHDWNIDTQDSIIKNITPQRIIANVQRQSKNKTMAVVLLHDFGRSAAVKALPQVLEFYQKAGYEFKVMDETTPVIAHRTKALTALKAKIEKR